MADHSDEYIRECIALRTLLDGEVSLYGKAADAMHAANKPRRAAQYENMVSRARHYLDQIPTVTQRPAAVEPRMTRKKVLRRLLDMAKAPGGHRDPFVSTELVDQENLYAIQERLMTLIEDLANDSGETDIVMHELPFMFRREG